MVCQLPLPADTLRPVEIDDRKSSELGVAFGVLWPGVIQPLYVNDLAKNLPTAVKAHRYAGDTTLYARCKPSSIGQYYAEIQEAIDKLSSWSSNKNPVLNPIQTFWRSLDWG